MTRRSVLMIAQSSATAVDCCGQHFAEFGDLFGVARSTVYRAVERDAARKRAKRQTTAPIQFTAKGSACGTANESSGLRTRVQAERAEVMPPSTASSAPCR